MEAGSGGAGAGGGGVGAEVRGLMNYLKKRDISGIGQVGQFY